MTLTPGQPVHWRQGRRKQTGVFKGYRREVREVAHILTPDGKHHFLMPERLETGK